MSDRWSVPVHNHCYHERVGNYEIHAYYCCFTWMNSKGDKKFCKKLETDVTCNTISVQPNAHVGGGHIAIHERGSACECRSTPAIIDNAFQAAEVARG